jgi:hypothetical protein
LQHVNVDAGLIVHAGGVKFLRTGGDRRITRNNLSNRTAVSFDTQ